MKRIDQTKIGEAIARAAMAIWQRGVYDDGGPCEEVTRLFDDNGWGAWLRAPELGGCPDGYERPPDPDYCGHGAACALRLIGDWLTDGQCVPVQVDPAICEKVMPSTYRIGAPGKWSDAGYERLDAVVFDDRTDDGQPTPRTGDIVVVETSTGKPYGDHITVARGRVDEEGLPTVEANAPGERPDGSWGKGVVRRHRDVGSIRQIVRFDTQHLVEVDG